MGPGTRNLFDEARDSGKLVVYALEDHPGTFESLECALSLLQQAHSGGKEIAPGTCPCINSPGERTSSSG